jgi:hypothetical protein
MGILNFKRKREDEKRYYVDFVMGNYGKDNFDYSEKFIKEYENLTLPEAKLKLKVIKQKIENRTVEYIDENTIINWGLVSNCFYDEE